MKELRSLAEVETALQAEGFFDAPPDELVADVYLGYGLSAAIRRDRTPAPPEPCPLPAAAIQILPCELRRVPECRVPPTGKFPHDQRCAWNIRRLAC